MVEEEEVVAYSSDSLSLLFQGNFKESVGEAILYRRCRKQT